MIDVIVQALAMLGTMVLGIAVLVVAQVIWQQLHPKRVQRCCPPLPAGQHFIGCTSAVRDA